MRFYKINKVMDNDNKLGLNLSVFLYINKNK